MFESKFVIFHSQTNFVQTIISVTACYHCLTNSWYLICTKQSWFSLKIYCKRRFLFHYKLQNMFTLLQVTAVRLCQHNSETRLSWSLDSDCGQDQYLSAEPWAYRMVGSTSLLVSARQKLWVRFRQFFIEQKDMFC